MPVRPIEAAFKATADMQSRPAATALAQSFKSALTQATKPPAANAETGTHDMAARKGEKMKAVSGHAYADILSGPRRHQYVNTSGNKRDGQAFEIHKRDGREYHIYGEGKDRVIVALKPAAGDTPSTTTAKPTSTTSGSFVSNG